MNRVLALVGPLLFLAASAAAQVPAPPPPPPPAEAAPRAPVLEPPRLVQRVAAAYPAEAARAGVGGVVVLELTVDAAGAVAAARVVTPAGHGFDEAALAAVQQFRFTPGRADGIAVPVRVTYRYAFTPPAPVPSAPPPASLPVAAPAASSASPAAPPASPAAPSATPAAPPATPAASPAAPPATPATPPVAPSSTPTAPPASPATPLTANSPALARLAGVILERGTRSPLGGVDIVVHDDTGAIVGRDTSAVDGRFAVPLAHAGAVAVTLLSPEHRPLTLRETVAAHEQLTVRYALTRKSYALYQSVVRGAPHREEVARVSLSGDEVRQIPGTRGDALAAVFTLPSVARAPFDLGQLVIRGSAPGESGAFLLGMSIPNAFHFGGLTSTFNSYLLDRFDLIPSNFSVRYGRLTGGVVDIEPREGRRDRIHGDIKADLYDAHVLVEGPVGQGSFALAARRSYVDAFLGLVVPSTRFTVAPRYYDYQAQLDYPVGGGKLKLLAFGADDELGLVSNTPPDADPSLAGQFSTRQWFHTLFASWRRRGPRLDIEATLAVGPQHFDAAIGAAARFTLDLVEADLRLEARYRLSARVRVTAGVDIQSDYFWAHVDAPEQTTEEVPLGPLSERPRLKLDNRGFEAAPAIYAQADLWAVAERLLVTPGVRLDRFSNAAAALVQPRLMARLRLGAETWLKAGAGLFHQAPQAPYGDAVLGNPALRPEAAWHFTLGVESRPLPKYRPLSVELNVFYKDIRNLAVSSDALTQRDGRVVPERYRDEGIGRVYGGDLLIKHDWGRRIYGWLAYTLLKSERRDHPGQPWRPFQYDQTHILTLVAGYHLPWEIDVGLRLRFVTGSPDTRLYAGPYDADAGITVPSYGAPYATRLPDFFALDVRVDKRFTFKRWILGIYVDVSNVTNHDNVEGYAYSYDYTRRAPVNGLPVVPSAGVRASF